MDISEKQLLFIDSGGIYQSFAERLSEEYGSVKYFSEWDDNEHDIRAAKKAVGEGGDFIKVDNWEKNVYDADVIFFPGCSKLSTQEDLKQRGFNVFGSGALANLENNREKFLDQIKEWKFPVPEYEIAVGIDDLLNKLEKIGNEIRFIKFSMFRSDMQTYKHWNFEASKITYEQLRLKQGTYANKIRFIIVTPIQGVETGRDDFVINGQKPTKFMGGYEIKNKAYAARIITNDNLPKPMIDFANHIAELSKELEVSTFWSDEVRVDGGKFYPLDFTARLGVPPNEILQRNCINLGEIIYHGSQGDLVEPIYEKEYAVQLFIDYGNDVDTWIPITYPDKYSRNIKPYNYTREDDIVWIIPSPDKHENTVCAVVGLGDSLEEAIEECIEICGTVEGENIDFDKNEFLDANKVIDEGSDMGIEIFD